MGIKNGVWIVDDDRAIRWVLEKALDQEHISWRSFARGADLTRILEEGNCEPEVLISDIRMPNENGLDLVKKVKAVLPALPVIVMTAYSDLENAVAAFEGGAFDYLPKPFDVDDAIALIRRALAAPEKGTEDAALPVMTTEILGQAPAMQTLFRAIGRLAQSHATVLLNGESGTGKELVARALHQHSPRKDKPFLAVNTAAIPRELLESEFFGHERGAFTGAVSQRAGRFEQAHNGTLFLDEIGDMPIDLQTRLLRVLSDGEFYRVGGREPIKANVRVIAATHQDLESLVEKKHFREDLFHRLNVIRLQLPPLRERPEDIPLLSRHFLDKSAKALRVEPKTLSVATIALLRTLPFPGNVRQLENLCHWLTVMVAATSIEPSDLPEDALKSRAKDETNFEWRAGLTREIDQTIAAFPGVAYEKISAIIESLAIARALIATGGNRAKAAQLLGIGRNTLTRKVQDYGIEI